MLAESMRVSRSPIRSALRLLAAEGVVSATNGGGFIVAGTAKTLESWSAPLPSDEDAYLAIAEDRLNDAIPARMTENALARRNNLTKAQLTRILRRMSGEGWIERLPGHGWALVPVLTSMHAYEDSNRFRLVIEPAAILEPGFNLDLPVLSLHRDQQQRLVDGEIWTISNARLFELNSKLHQAIIACSGNTFFVEALKRVDVLRRLMEYRQSLDRTYASTRCREHVRLIDLLFAERRHEASAFMHEHLSSVSVEKMILRTEG